MSIYGVQVTMSTPWKGLQEEFSNVFHYDGGNGFTGSTDFNELADKVVAEMRPIHGTVVNFKRVRVFGPTEGSKAANIMQLVKDLTGTGSGLSGGGVPPESAVLGWVYVGRGPNGGKQILRKYIHCLRLPDGTGNNDIGNAVSPLTSGQKAPFVTRLNNLNNVLVGGINVPICTEAGKHLPLNSTWAINDYTTTRQFRRRSKRRTTSTP